MQAYICRQPKYTSWESVKKNSGKNYFRLALNSMKVISINALTNINTTQQIRRPKSVAGVIPHIL